MSALQIHAELTGSLQAFPLNATFDAPMRGVTALFGPSGSGKTTILRCIAGLQRMSGSLRVGADVWQDDARRIFLPPHRRQIGYVFQEASLFAHLSVDENLGYGARRAARQGATARLEHGDVIEMLGLGALLGRSPRALSGGERQRVALGRALLSQPRLLLMDEPLAALDRRAREEILPYFQTLQQTLSIPILYVSHDIGEVTRLADTMLVVSDGRVIAQGAVQPLLERLDLHPETGRFEAGVLLTARISGHDQEFMTTRVDHHGQAIVVPLIEAAIGEWVRLRIRARDVMLATRRPQSISARNLLAGEVVEVVEENTSAYAETLVDIGGARLRARLTRAAVAELGITPGLKVFAVIKAVAIDRHLNPANDRGQLT